MTANEDENERCIFFLKKETYCTEASTKGKCISMFTSCGKGPSTKKPREAKKIDM